MAVKEYTREVVKEELKNMGFVEDGIIGFGQTALNYGGGLIGSVIANAVSDKFAIVRIGEKVGIVPYESDKINYDKIKTFNKGDILKAKATGGVFLARRLLIWTKDGKKHRYFITHGKDEVKVILNKLGISSKNPKKEEAKG